MREKTDLKTLILAAKNGKKFVANIKGSFPLSEYVFIDDTDWSPKQIIADWEVEWFKEPMKIERDIVVGHYYDSKKDEYLGQILLTKETLGRRFKLVLTEIVEGE